MARRRLKPAARLLIILVIVGGIGGIYYWLSSYGMLEKLIPNAKETGEIKPGDFDGGNSGGKLDRPIRVGVVTWGGYAGGQYFNGGFKASKESRYYKEYGIEVEFVLNDDFVSSRAAWKVDDIDLQWITADSFPTEVESLSEFKPKIVFQSDWSRGGDAIVVRPGINAVSDLKDKKIAVAFGTPSHTFLIWLLSTGGLNYSDIKLVEAPSAVQAATFFKTGNADAAVVWSPDDEDCVQSVSGAKVLISTKQASFIIADVFYAKENFIKSHPNEIKSLIEGWMKGTAEINNSEDAKKKAAQILADGLKQPYAFCLLAINNVRLTTLGDNLLFFGLGGDSKVTKGEQLYSRMTDLYSKINLAGNKVPPWRSIIYTDFVEKINLTGREHAAEGQVKFAPIAESQIKDKKAISTKRVTIAFPSGSFTLDENAKYIIQMEFVDIAKAFGHSRIRVEGNTDNVGNLQANIALSKKRAQSVADFLANDFGFDRNRFVIEGNGPNNPVASNDNEEGRAKNRRTDFELLSE